jgi:hypothetical protein
MPWQRQVSDLVNEVDPATGLRVHPFVVVTVQRQAGKTTWLMAEAVERCLFGAARRVWYTAQSGLYAREKWAETAHQLLAPGSPLVGRVGARWSAGSECLTFPSGSTFRPFPPTRDALHGHQSHLVIVDEGWRHSVERGQELLQAIGPTQATVPGAQVLVVSTQGTAASAWFHELVDRGRAGDPAIALADWGIADTDDPMDLQAVAAAHPAIGHTIDRSFLEREAGLLSRNEFARAYGNIRTQAEQRYIPEPVWKAAADPAAPVPDPVVLAAEVAQDRTRTAIVAVSAGSAEVVESRAGLDWAAPRLAELVAAHRPAALVVDPRGPSAALHDQLARAGVTLYPWKATDGPAACLHLMDALTAGRVRIRPHPNLDEAADAAVPRISGDGWVWGRRLSGGPIAELVALSWGLWVDLHRPAAPVMPRLITSAD